MRLKRIINEDLEWDTFRSEVCHMLHFEGGLEFISKMVLSNAVPILFEKQKYSKALYIVAMVDYVSWKNHLPFNTAFDRFRECRLNRVAYPSDVILMDELECTRKHREAACVDCKDDPCGRFFFRYNIIEKDVENVV